MSIELKPCPHCGEVEHLYPSHYWPGSGAPYAIDCVGCGTDFTPRPGKDVIAAWNRRDPDAAKDAEIKRLREALEPFALVAEHDIGDDEDNGDRFTPILGELNRAPKITVGHMRAALAALSTPDPAGGMPVEVET